MNFKEVFITLFIALFFSFLTAQAVLVAEFLKEQIKKIKYKKLVDSLSTSWEDD